MESEDPVRSGWSGPKTKMKIIVTLCAMIGVVLVLEGCADQGSKAVASNPHAYHGLVDPGSVAPVYGGPAPGHIRQRYEP